MESEQRLARDRGLVRGIGTAGLAAGIVNAVVAAGVFTLPAAVAALAGAWAPLTYVICGAVMAGVVICFADAGSRVPTSGGAYGTVEAALGPAAGFITGALLVVSDIFASGGIAAALADLLAGFLPRTVLLLVLYAILAAINLIGVRFTARLITVATVVKLAPLALFLLIAAAAAFAPPPPGPWPAAHGFGRALILTLFAFTGMETALGASGEVRAPNRTLPRALFLAMLFTLALYLAVQAGSAHLLGPALANSTAPLADSAARVSPLARRLLLAGAALSMFLYLVSDVLGTSRMLFAMSRDGALPPWLAALNPRTHVPARAVIAYTVVCVAAALSGSFIESLVLSSLAVVGVYTLGCIAAWLLWKRNVALAGQPLGWRAVPLAATIGLAGMAGMILSARPIEVAGLAAVAAAAFLWYWLYAARRAR